MTDEKNIEYVLDCCKSYELYYVKRKADNKNFRYQDGYLPEDIDNEIRNLLRQNLFEGPAPDVDRPGRFVWIFKKSAFGKWCYIKLAIKKVEKLVIIMSFHEDEGVEYK